MTDWRGQTADASFAMKFDTSVLSTLDRYCLEAGSSETGGILIGRYSDDLSLAIVQEATPPPTDSRRGRSWFVRGINGLRDILGKRWRAKDRTHYLGEWHFHPVDQVEPSSEDFDQMLKISRSKEYDCREPLLLILSSGKHRRKRAFRAFVCPAGGEPKELLPASGPPIATTVGGPS